MDEKTISTLVAEVLHDAEIGSFGKTTREYRLAKAVVHLTEHRDLCCSVAAQAEADFERWRDAKNEYIAKLEKLYDYATHLPDCSKRVGVPLGTECTCGLEQAMEDVEEWTRTR